MTVAADENHTFIFTIKLIVRLVSISLTSGGTVKNSASEAGNKAQRSSTIVHYKITNNRFKKKIYKIYGQTLLFFR